MIIQTRGPFPASFLISRICGKRLVLLTVLLVLLQNTMRKQRKADVLVVEDDPGDALLVEMTLTSEPKTGISVAQVGDGQEALDFLYRRNKHAHAPRPDLVFLDLNLPKIDGREVLRTLKADADLSAIPVVVLSTSESPSDVEASYRAGANSYIVKPRDLNDTLEKIALCRSYWLDVVRLEQPSQVLS
jgi:CheY-like chemotaxis protein